MSRAKKEKALKPPSAAAKQAAARAVKAGLDEVLRVELLAWCVAKRRGLMPYDRIATDLVKEFGPRLPEGFADTFRAAQAKALVQEGLDRLVPWESVEEVRRMEVERLQALAARIYPVALTNDPYSIKSYLAVTARWAALEGLDAPAKVNVTVKTPAEFAAELDAELRVAGIIDVDSTDTTGVDDEE